MLLVGCVRPVADRPIGCAGLGLLHVGCRGANAEVSRSIDYTVICEGQGGTAPLRGTPVPGGPIALDHTPPGTMAGVPPLVAAARSAIAAACISPECGVKRRALTPSVLNAKIRGRLRWWVLWSMLEDLRRAAHRTVGTKQTLRAVERGQAERVFVARDADAHVLRQLLTLSRLRGLPIREVESMQVLGRACGVEVGAASAAILVPDPPLSVPGGRGGQANPRSSPR